jgi:hypothetical protein
VAPEIQKAPASRGLGIAFLGAAAVLFFFHVIRPTLAAHQIPTHIPEDVATFLKGTIAFTSLGLGLWALMRRLAGRNFARSAIDTVAVTMAVLSVVAFTLVDDLRPEVYIHKWEQFHYYLGSKYSSELGYTRLYYCTAVAQSELSTQQRTETTERLDRNLETNNFESAAIAVDNPDVCKSHFSEEKWASFKNDVRWFRFAVGRSFFESAQRDHGYNPPPVWTMEARFFDALFPRGASIGTMRALASIDPIVYALTFFFVWWAFGLRTLCVVLIFWGTQFPASAYFTSAAFLRQDWLFFLVLAACLLRKHYWALAGAALAWSALLRIFPVIFFAGIVVVALAHLAKHRRVAKHHLRFFAGAAAAAIALVSASAILVGPRSYVEFARHIEHHGRTPLSNNMGLPVLVSITRSPPQSDEVAGVKWPAEHWAAFRRRYPIFLACNVLVVFVFVQTVRRIKTLWMAMALGAALLCSLTQLTCYYYSFFIVPVLLARASPRTALGALFAAGVSAILVIWPRISAVVDDRYEVQSVVFLGFALLTLLGFSPWRLESSDRAEAA